MAARKTAAQKAAEAAEREEYTGIPEHPEEAVNDQDNNLTDVVDDKGKRLTVQQLKNKLRNEAEREVLDAHRPEVISRTAAKYKDHNLEYVRRLTDEEKAAKQIEELYAKFPQLRPQTEQQQQQQEEPAVVTRAQREAFDEQTAEEESVETFRTEYPEEGELPEPELREDYPAEYGQ